MGLAMEALYTPSVKVSLNNNYDGTCNWKEVRTSIDCLVSIILYPNIHGQHPYSLLLHRSYVNTTSRYRAKLSRCHKKNHIPCKKEAAHLDHTPFPFHFVGQTLLGVRWAL